MQGHDSATREGKGQSVTFTHYSKTSKKEFKATSPKWIDSLQEFDTCTSHLWSNLPYLWAIFFSERDMSQRENQSISLLSLSLSLFLSLSLSLPHSLSLPPSFPPFRKLYSVEGRKWTLKSKSARGKSITIFWALTLNNALAVTLGFWPHWGLRMEIDQT